MQPELSALIAALEDCSLEPAGFDHRGHLRAAYAYARIYGAEAGGRRFDAALRRYAEHLGAAQKYHATVTGALWVLQAQAAEAAPAAGFEALLAARPELLEARALLERHYSPAVLDSAEAKARFVAPDRLPFPS